jgi:anti-sigma regulatory factor (Ser/Thr protein kinase)
MAGINQVAVAVQDPSQVADARRQATTLGAAQGLDEDALGRLSICVTELATNLIKHAAGGSLLLRPLRSEAPLSDRGAAPRGGVEVLALDKGPGMANIGQSMRDGHSTAGSPGNGLGALARMGSGFDVYSLAGKGTALRLEIWPRSHGVGTEALEFGAVVQAKRGETEAGDACAVASGGGRFTLMVADGLGHGPLAAAASNAALEVLSSKPWTSPAGLLEAVHAGIASTRGAAAAVATVDLASGRGLYCGVGNISGIAYAEGKSKHLISHNGTLGHNARKIQEFDFEWPAGALLVMFSDGLASHWSLADHPGLEAKHPALISAVLCRDHERGRDDVTVAALRRIAP